MVPLLEGPPYSFLPVMLYSVSELVNHVKIYNSIQQVLKDKKWLTFFGSFTTFEPPPIPSTCLSIKIWKERKKKIFNILI